MQRCGSRTRRNHAEPRTLIDSALMHAEPASGDARLFHFSIAVSSSVQSFCFFRSCLLSHSSRAAARRRRDINSRTPYPPTKPMLNPTTNTTTNVSKMRPQEIELHAIWAAIDHSDHRHEISLWFCESSLYPFQDRQTQPSHEECRRQKRHKHSLKDRPEAPATFLLLPAFEPDTG